MLSIFSFFSDITCGPACWEAREHICHCSCGGKNHGVLRSPDGQRPNRTAKIDGVRYELVAVGPRRDLYKEADKLNNGYGFSRVEVRIAPDDYYHYTRGETDKGAPGRLKYATKDQLAKWPELSAYANAPRYDDISLLWARVDMPTPVYCPSASCSRCESQRARAIGADSIKPEPAIAASALPIVTRASSSLQASLF